MVSLLDFTQINMFMKRKLRLLTALLVILIDMGAYGQQYDRHWLGGEGTVFSDTAIAILMKFEDNGITYSNFHSELIHDRSVIAMSNAAGELQFYTNGNAVASWDNSIMLGGKGFNQGSEYDDFDSFFGDTVINDTYLPYTYQVIPDADDGNIYYMIHAFIVEEGECSLAHVPKMQISKIDMSANSGRGEVFYKNHYFDEELVGPCFAMVRHGNGRDWWVVLRRLDGLAYRSVLLQRDSVVQVVQSSVPGLSSSWFDCADWWTTNRNLLTASRDGSRMVDIYGHGWAKLLDFDRCSGAVSLVDTIHTGITQLEVSGGFIFEYDIYGFEFSSSGRYLYGIGFGEAAQWDLWAGDIAASKVKLGGVPWALDENQNVMEGTPGGSASFAHGPDGRIYNLFRNMHSIIEYPDEPGEASGLCLAADSPPSCLGVPYNIFSTPHPNYRLGPLTGSGCDTILSSTKPPLAGSGYGVVASPSVASGQAEVSITLPSYGGGTAELQVVDMLGRVVYQHRFPPYAYLHSLEVSGWPVGLYNVVLLENGRARAGARVVVGR